MQVNTAKEVHATFDEIAIKAYVEDRIQELHVILETVPEAALSEVQGQIKELRYLLRAKGYARDVLEKAKK